jgi:FkbM family methyltransferase
MLVDRFVRFVQRPAAERRVTVRFFARKALAKLPCMPIRTRMTVAPGEHFRFWWSYLPMADHSDRTLWEYWGDDRGELRFLWQFLRPGMAFFDIGAYHGIFSLLAAKRLSLQGQVVAFEPSQRECRRFELHMRWNGLSGVRLEPCAVSSTSGTFEFFAVASGFTSMNSLKPPPISHPIREIKVRAVSLDAYLTGRGVTRIDLMKIDVEGGELEAFRGAVGMLSAIRPILICEVLDWVTRPWGYPAREIVSYLRERGYYWFDFRDDGTIYPHAQRDEYPEIRNYLAVPREKLALVERWEAHD